MSSSAARVWMTTGLPVLGRARAARRRAPAARPAARSRGSSRDPSRRRATARRMREQRPQLLERRERRVAGLVRVDAEARVDALVASARASGVARAPSVVATAITRSTPAARARVERLGRVVAEVRVRVDQGRFTPRRRRAARCEGRAAVPPSIPSPARGVPYATCSQPSSGGWPSAARIFGAVAGR